MINERYSTLYAQYLRLIQKYASSIVPVHPQLAPIGTNIMLVANELRSNSKLRRKTIVTPGVYDFDVEGLEQFNREYGTAHEALPWVLQRYDGHENDPNPWTIWFKDLTVNGVDCADHPSRLEELEDELWRLRDRVDDPDLLEYGACVDYVCRFNDKTHRLVASHNYVTDDHCVAVHIRRGDAWNEEVGVGDPDRRKCAKEEYIEKMELFAELGYTDFYVLTESQDVVDAVREYFWDRCRVMSQQVDRTEFLTPQKPEDAENYGVKDFVEYQSLDNPAFLEFLMNTALVDIHNARRCDAFIGTLLSQFSALNYLGIVGRKRRPVPHFNLSEGDHTAFDFNPTISSRSEPFLAITGAECDFFSLFNRVVHTLAFLDEHRSQALPYVLFTDKERDRTDTKSWRTGFESVVPIHDVAIEAHVRWISDDYRQGGSQDRQTDEKELVEVKPNVFWTSSWFPLVDNTSMSSESRRIEPPSADERRVAAVVIGKYIRARRRLRLEVDEFFRHLFMNRYVIGVQWDGTAIRGERARAQAALVEAVRMPLRERSSRRNVGIFVSCDDDPRLASRLSELSDHVHVFDTKNRRSSLPDEIVNGYRATPVETDRRHGTIERSVMDYLALCECNFMVHTHSSISRAVLLTKPDLPNAVVDGV